MRAETGSGLPTPVCWASTSTVSNETSSQNPLGGLGKQGGISSGIRMLDVCQVVTGWASEWQIQAKRTLWLLGLGRIVECSGSLETLNTVALCCGKCPSG